MQRSSKSHVWQRPAAGPARAAKNPIKTNGYDLDLVPLPFEAELEAALRFLVRLLDRRGRAGKKPVIIHSLSVAFRLIALGYDDDVVVAGLLHDLAEKTRVSRKILTRNFGSRVARLVAAVTNDDGIRDPIDRYADSVLRCRKAGADALAVRAADLLDNFDRLADDGDPRRLQRLNDKVNVLLPVCQAERIAPSLIAALKECQRRTRRAGTRLRVVGGRKAAPRKGR